MRQRFTPPYLAFPIALLWLATVMGQLGRSNWVFDLFSHFTVQYAALFGLLLLAVLLLRRYLLAGIASLGLAVNAAPTFAYALDDANAPSPGVATLRIVSFNVFFRNDPIDALQSYLRETDPDVVVLQEFQRALVPELLRRHPDHHQVALIPEQDGLTTTVLLSRIPILDSSPVASVALAPYGVQVRLEIGGRPVTLFGLHLDWPMEPDSAAQRNAELVDLATRFQQCSDTCIALGDFNLSPWSPYYDSFVEGSGATDCARGKGLKTTWPTFFPPLGIRIDHCFTKGLVDAVAVTTGPSFGSDHAPTLTELRLR